ncbi:High affinity cGMP-specific 3',5'-cyclic phosphodiesterase 9A [Melipona quadrifasciata]|uniref:Phosphodiesterase n=1 Tax=Melipona quadrifasciata TaxID=166423 RepID=A0A0M9A3F7_9HYME|nr:High affinity cGMP-specific 3',5'-cyclic phosphodiesterase 9A [Melipona quadrifasciata]
MRNDCITPSYDVGMLEQRNKEETRLNRTDTTVENCTPCSPTLTKDSRDWRKEHVERQRFNEAKSDVCWTCRMDHEGAQRELVVDERSFSLLVPRRPSTGSCNAESFTLQVLRTAARSNRKASPCKLSQGRAQRSGRRFKADISCLAMDLEARNGTGGNDDEEYTNIYFIVGDRRETVTYKADQVTDMELKGNSFNSGTIAIILCRLGNRVILHGEWFVESPSVSNALWNTLYHNTVRVKSARVNWNAEHGLFEKCCSLEKLFRNAAEAGPLDIVKLCKGDKLLNISTNLPANTPDSPYVLQIVGAHPASSGVIEAEVLWALERRVAALERQLREHQEALYASPSFALRELKRQVDSFKNKLEHNDQLSWLSNRYEIDQKLKLNITKQQQQQQQQQKEQQQQQQRIALFVFRILPNKSNFNFFGPSILAVLSGTDCIQEDLESMNSAFRKHVETKALLNFAVGREEGEDTFQRELYHEFNQQRAFQGKAWQIGFCHNFSVTKISIMTELFNKLYADALFDCKINDVSVSSSVREWLRSPAFDARQWEDEELLLMLQTMFVELDLPQKFNIPLPILRNFLYEMYAIAWAVDLPSRIGDLEVFILIVSCICHDLDHPGYNNIYQINARTELALRYNDISPLENHHCSVAFRVLEAPECNILASLDNATYRVVREGIIRCILATDMARHNEILGQFTDIIPEFDYSSKAHINLLSMILIKVADISNEARPMEVAEPWLDRLLQEFFKQSDAEKLEGLPVTPFMDRDKVTKPSSQVSFIGLVLLPLFEALGELLPELQSLIVQPVREALEYYRRLNEAAKDERVVKSTSSHSMRSKRSAGTVHSRSRSTDDDITENLTGEEAENLESSDPETATEVEVSEKTLKFKISTEGTLAGPATGRKSYPGSRKGSREKSSLDYHNHDLARAVREHERERKRSKGESLGSDLSSPMSAWSAEGTTRILEELEKDETQALLDAKLNERRTMEGNGNVVVESQQRNNLKKTSSLAIENEQETRSSRKEVQRESVVGGLRCCCEDKTGSNNHKSIFSRLRNFTDRLSISFDSKEPPAPKPTKHVTKTLNKSNSVTAATTSARHNNTLAICKRCNLAKVTMKESKAIATVVELSSVDKRAMTLPKVRKSTDYKNKSWRMVFAKEKRSSASLEALPGAMSESSLAKHRRNSSNPEGKSHSMKDAKDQVIESSASMEDISKMAKQAESAMLCGTLEPKKAEERPHAGSLDSMLYKDSAKSRKKPTYEASPTTTSKKPSSGLLSRFKSGMSIDSTRSNSNSDSLHDQSTQSPSGWISSLTASFRPKRQVPETPQVLSSHPPRSPSREEIKHFYVVTPKKRYRAIDCTVEHGFPVVFRLIEERVSSRGASDVSQREPAKGLNKNIRPMQEFTRTQQILPIERLTLKPELLESEPTEGIKSFLKWKYPKLLFIFWVALKRRKVSNLKTFERIRTEVNQSLVVLVFLLHLDQHIDEIAPLLSGIDPLVNHVPENGSKELCRFLSEELGFNILDHFREEEYEV